VPFLAERFSASYRLRVIDPIGLSSPNLPKLGPIIFYGEMRSLNGKRKTYPDFATKRFTSTKDSRLCVKFRGNRKAEVTKPISVRLLSGSPGEISLKVLHGHSFPLPSLVCLPSFRGDYAKMSLRLNNMLNESKRCKHRCEACRLLVDSYRQYCHYRPTSHLHQSLGLHHLLWLV